MKPVLSFLAGYLLVVTVAHSCACIHAPPNEAQRIARDMASCLSMPSAFEHNDFALECLCEAQYKCEVLGLDKKCAWDEWILATNGHYPLIVGECK